MFFAKNQMFQVIKKIVAAGAIFGVYLLTPLCLWAF